jgi:hypothetical protein
MAVDRPVAFAFSSTSSIPDVPFPVSMPAQMGGDFFLFHDPALGRRSWCSGKPYGFGEEPLRRGSGGDLAEPQPVRLWRRSGPRREAKMAIRAGRSFQNKESLYGFANPRRRR